MKERPILFSAPNVKAILDDRKTMTRRIVKRRQIGAGRDIDYRAEQLPAIACPYGKPGDRLWVREQHCFLDVTKSKMSRFPLGPQNGNARGPDIWNLQVEYSDGAQHLKSVEGQKPKQTRERGDIGWRPSIHMPRWASRITLEVTDVRVERLQEISEADAIAEGVNVHPDHHGRPRDSIYGPVQAYVDLWSNINGPDSWPANPWVWVISFRRC